MDRFFRLVIIILLLSSTTLAQPVPSSKVDVSRVGGTAIDANSGVKSAGTQRVVLATDQPQLTNPLKTDGSGVTQPVSAVSLPLPAGAALDATLTGGTQKTKIVDTGGTNVASVNAAGAVKVDNSGNTQPVSGTVTTTPPANASTNVAQVAGTTTDTNSGVKSAGTLRVVLATDQPQLTNKILVTPDSVALPANQSVNVAQFAGATAITSGVTGSQAVGGDTAAAATDAGNPLKIGGVGRTTNPTAVTDGQRVNGLFDKLGKQISVPAIRVLKGRQVTTITASTAETTIVTADATNFLDIYCLIITNTSATATNITIKDATAGTTVQTFAVPAADNRGFCVEAGSAITQSTVNNNWTATSSASVSSVIITAYYVKNL